MGRKPLGKIRWQVTIPAEIAASFDASVPNGKNRNDILELAILAYLKKRKSAAKPRAAK